MFFQLPLGDALKDEGSQTREELGFATLVQCEESGENYYVLAWSKSAKAEKVAGHV